MEKDSEVKAFIKLIQSLNIQQQAGVLAILDGMKLLGANKKR